jgi:deazaflavin-dependent oxidoreductase (nitroreductase family)
MSVATTTPPARRERSNALFVAATRVFNKVVLLVAGTRWMPLYGVMEHRGRRSGKIFHTPVVVRPTSEGFTVPMPWGETTDWYRNVRAAGGCRIRWKDHEYVLGQPEVVDTSAAGTSFGGFQRNMMRRFGIQKVLRLRRAY